MVKVTGGGTKVGQVAAHFRYISRNGKLEIETDDGVQLWGRDEQREMLKSWHLELTAGRYRRTEPGESGARSPKLVQNIVLSMPASTSSQKVLAAAKVFAREKFGARHRYAMVLHTDQQHPHVHIVVKAEAELDRRRLHIDKETLRTWREDFARAMRAQGIEANATRKAVRDHRRGWNRDARVRVWRSRDGAEIDRISANSYSTLTKPADLRKAVVSYWSAIAVALDRQGEVILANETRLFIDRIPTDPASKTPELARDDGRAR